MADDGDLPLHRGWTKTVRGATTVRRMLRQQPDPTEAAEREAEESSVTVRVVKAKYSHHVWSLDLTVVPTAAGFWVPWAPFSKLQRWPFCWWVAVVLDHFSRRVCGFALFPKLPTSTNVCAFLDRVSKQTGARPKHIITDKGRQFSCETFNLVPFGLHAMRHELGCYITWYNEHRPHQSLAGMTPAEVYDGSATGDRPVRFEPRLRWPLPAGSRQTRARKIHMVVRFSAGRRHLPLIELSRAA